jgi:CshA-type fibril repeat protein
VAFVVISRIVASAAAGVLVGAGIAGVGASTAVGAPTPGSTLSILAGDGNYSAVVPGPAASSPMYYPQLLATDGLNNVFVGFESSASNSRGIAKIDASGTVSFLLNSSNTFGTPNVGGAAISSPFGYVTGLAADAAGNVYVSSGSTYKIYKIDTTGQLSLLAGTGTRSPSTGPLGTGAPTSVDITPSMLGVSADGATVYFMDLRAGRIGKISAGALTSVAGDGTFGAPTPGTTISPVLAVNSPLGGSTYDALAVDSSGDLFMSAASCVTMIHPTTNELTSVAGVCGASASPTPGPAASSSVNDVRDIAIDRNDNLYIADRGSYRILKVTDPDSGTGTLSYVAGDGVNGVTTPGAATAVHIRGMNGLAVTRRMDVVMSENYGTYIAKVAGVPSVPDAPTGLNSSAGNASVTLTFAAPEENGGSSVTGYEYSTNGGGTWVSLTASGSGPFTVPLTGLSNGTAYTLSVRAVNVVGSSVGSNTTSFTPHAPPPAPPGPSPTNLTSNGIGTAVQTATATLTTGQSITLLDGALPVETVTVAHVGTYRLNTATGAITFTPVLGYAGTAVGVTFRITNSDNSDGSALYVPTVAKPAAPAPAALSSIAPGVQHVTISLKEGETATLLDSAGIPTTSAVTIVGEGTYELDPTTAIITFTPADGFTGTGTGIGFQVTDAYGQRGVAAYEPTIGTPPPPTSPPTPTPTSSPTPTPKPLPKIDRKELAKIPKNPEAVKGKERKTKAFNSSFNGVDAHPIVKLGDRRLAKGQATTLSGDGLFDFDSAKLTKKGRAQVKSVVSNLKGTQAVKCEGYTDYAGAPDHELDLSAARAKAVCMTLKAYGAKFSTKTKGYGPQRPVVVGGTAKGRKENRRVVILVTK